MDGCQGLLEFRLRAGGLREESAGVPWGSGKTLGLSAEHQLSQLPLWWPGNALPKQPW